MSLTPQIKELLDRGIPVAQVAKMVGCSRQNVDAVRVTTGKKVFEPQVSREIYATLFARANYKCQLGIGCKQSGFQRLAIIAYEPTDDTDLMLAACNPCKLRANRLINNTQILKTVICNLCGEEYTSRNSVLAYKKCATCLKKYREERKKLWSKKYKLLACVICGKNDSPHNSKGKCKRCSQRERFKNPAQRIKHRLFVKRWKENNKEKAKAIQRKARIKWYDKNREKVNEDQRKRTRRKQEQKKQARLDYLTNLWT